MATGLTTLRHLKDNDIAGKVAAQGEWLKGKLAICRSVSRSWVTFAVWV
ncbi:diaminobutyrate--2-oxoglutarate aminotransferase [Raoultella planticola]|uniref:Diaminobutyrate--2-oxoglutarate aminotransferase n=1 Tax=Raoultella planticola TaxID=575 RepID=A0A485CWE5_RAOPL|nr:diaminobutyrate--2-oxoglutarate aminotransferase [Raoultella planticola]